MRRNQRCRIVLTFDVQRIDDVMIDQFEVLVSNPMLDVSLATGEEIIRDDHLVSLKHQAVHQVRTDEAKVMPRRCDSPQLPSHSPRSASNLHVQTDQGYSARFERDMNVPECACDPCTKGTSLQETAVV